jgi:tetratricopeptide (TPR) repeat protein
MCAELSRNALETTIDRLSALSLVDVLAGEERYALHPLTRNFVRDELLSEPKAADDTGRRFARYWVTFARRNGANSPNYKTFNILESEWPNIEAAAEWLWHKAAVRGENVGDQQACSMLNDTVTALRAFLRFGGRWDEQVHLSSRAYEAMCATNEWSHAGWRAYDAAWIYNLRQSLADEGSFWVERAVDAWTHGGDKYEQASGARQRQQYGDAKRLLEEALATFHELQIPPAIAIVLNDLGGVTFDCGHYDEAIQYIREALKLNERLQDKEGMASCFGNLARLAGERGRWAEAKEWGDKALSLAREIGLQDRIGDTLYNLAFVYEHEGDHDRALLLAEEALAIHQRLRDSHMARTKQMVEGLRAAARSGKEER